jgi:alpha-tubulin suppressor-like RCC1 family protein
LGGCTAPTCTAGATRCNGKKVETCNADWTGWATTATCSIDCVGGACLEVTALATTLDTASCALLNDGNVRCWGDNGEGQIGDGTTTHRPTPVVIPSLAGAKYVGLAGLHGCSIQADNTVACWGLHNYDGYLGDGTSTGHLTPQPVPGLTNVAALAVGGDDNCALTTSGRLKCWGYGFHNLGGSRVQHNAPFDIGLSGVNAVAAGWHTFCALQSGTLSCWGENQYGQVGDGTQVDRYSLNPIPGAFVAIRPSYATMCAQKSDMTWLCWGMNNGFADIGALGDIRPSPISASSYAGTDKQLFPGAAAMFGYGSGLVLLSSGKGPFCGDGSNVDRLTAEPNFDVAPISLLAAGFDHTCVVVSGRVWCWGMNDYGEVGNGYLEPGYIYRNPTPVVW